MKASCTKFLSTVHRGEQGRLEDAEAEAAETGTATPRGLPASETIPEHLPGRQAQNGVAGSPDLSGLAGADVSLRSDDNSSPAGASVAAAGSAGSLDALAGASSSSQGAGSGPVASQTGGTAHDLDDVLVGGVDGREANSGSRSELQEVRMVDFSADGAAGVHFADTLAGPSADAPRSSTLNPLFELELEDAGPAATLAASTRAPAVQSRPPERLHEGAGTAARDRADGAAGPLPDSVSVADGGGEVRVRRQTAVQHPSILRQSTWTDPEAAPRPTAS